MHHKLSVLVQVDLDGRHVRLVVTGCLTEVSHRGLTPLVRRARTLVPGIAVVVDATAALHVEASAVDMMRWSTEHEDAVPGTPPVEFVLPEDLPAHDVVTRLAAWTGPRRHAERTGPAAPAALARRRAPARSRLAG